jgi:hypothetical protein
VTSPTGTFAFNSLFLPQTTQLRVRPIPAEAVSDVITVGVAVKVKTNVSTTRVTRGRRIRFSGTIRPARRGRSSPVQKRTRDGRWVVVAGGITRSGGQSFSGFTGGCASRAAGATGVREHRRRQPRQRRGPRDRGVDAPGALSRPPGLPLGRR